jgi:hypothetical protein
MRRPAAALLAFGLLAACASAESLEPSEGGAGDPCYPNGTCNAALVCVGGQCVAPDAGATGGSTSGGGGAGGATGGATSGGGSSGGGATGGATSGGGGTGGSTGGAGGATGGTGGGATGGGGGGATGGTGGSTTGGGGTGGSTGGAGGTGGASGAPPPPGAPSGCTTCGCCDPWLIKWTASAGATHYNVIWKCSIFPQHVINVGSVVQADLCSSTVGMCASSECANGVGALQIQACNASGCSAAVSIPSAGVPIACGGGCCC